MSAPKAVTLVLPAETIKEAKAAARGTSLSAEEWLAAILVGAVPHNAAGESLARKLEGAGYRGSK